MNLVLEEQIKKVIWLLPLLLIIVSIPLAVFGRAIALYGIYFEAWTGVPTSYDFFTYYRSLLIITFAAVALLLTLLHSVEAGFVWRKNIFMAPLLLYLVLLVLSSVFSEFQIVSLLGFVERQEGLLMLVGYLILMVSAYQLIRSDFEIKVLLYPLLVVSAVVGIIGVGQYFGYDFFNTVLGRQLILPENLMQINENLRIGSGKYTIYGTMYNSNYVGSFMALLLPLSAGLYLISKRPLATILLGVHTCLMFANWIGCRSRAGLVGAMGALILLLFLLKHEWLSKKRRLLLVIPMLLIFYGMNQASDGSLLTKMSSLSPSIEKSFTETQLLAIQDIVFTKESATIITAKQTLTIQWAGGKLAFLDDQKNVLKTRVVGEDMTFQDERYLDYKFTVHAEGALRSLSIKLKAIGMVFYMDDAGIYLMSTQNSIYNKIYHAPSFGFEGREQFGSNRGYIWSRALPLLTKTIWLGNGPDTFAINFPQEDLVGKLNNFGRTTMIVDKPHNYYIQVAHDTGVLSLLALLSVFLIYFIQSFKLFVSSKESNYLSNVGRIILCAVLGYLVTAIFNDSVVFVAPFFWIFLGCGFALNATVLHPEAVKSPEEIQIPEISPA